MIGVTMTKKYNGPKNQLVDNLTEDLFSLDLESRSFIQQMQTSDLLVDAKKHGKVYTFGDAFCEAGGVSRGA